MVLLAVDGVPDRASRSRRARPAARSGCSRSSSRSRIVSYSWGTISTQSIQNVLVYIACLLFTAIAATVIRYRPRQLYDVISKAWWVAGSVGLGMYAVGVAARRPGQRTRSSRRGRSACWACWSWRGSWQAAASAASGPTAWWAPSLLLTLLSLSRSALAAQFAMVALARFDLRTFRSWMIAIGAIVVTLSIAIATVFLYAPLHHRFFHGDTANVGGFSDQRHRPRRALGRQLGLLPEGAA